MTDQNPLVSIIVITYNSEEFVLETLESAKAQTYQNIELIISDDCSEDNTVRVCQKWIQDNNTRFYNCKLITSSINTGVSSNINRGIRASNGQWVKLISGDDKLEPDCIEKYIDFVLKKNATIYIIHSNVKVYNNEFKEKNLKIITNKENDILNSERITPLGQFKVLLFLGEFVHAPSVFINKELFNKVGYFDERMKLIEDIPFWLRVTRMGYKIYFLNEVTTNYRRHSKSISFISVNDKLYFQKKIERSIRYKEYIFPYINYFERILYKGFIHLQFLNNNKISRIQRICTKQYMRLMKIYFYLCLKFDNKIYN